MMGVLETLIEKELTMKNIILKLPKVKRKEEERPKKCKYCEGETFQRWGKMSKPVRDSQYRTVEVYRYRCCRCGRTFRQYPEGVDQADQTLRMRKLMALCWVMGLSLRNVTLLLSAFNIEICHMTVWRDLQEQAGLVKQGKKWQPVRVIGVDGLYPLGKGKKEGVLIAVDLGEGKPVAIARVDESNPAAVKRFLSPLVQRLGVRVIVTDDLMSFRIAAEQLQLEHQVCQFHVRRWVNRSLKQLRETVPKEYLWVIDEAYDLLAELPGAGSRRLFELWKQIPERQVGVSGRRTPLSQLRHLLLRMSEHWDSYRVFAWQEHVPWTNNGTEQVIGRMKMRSRTVRGYKSWQGMQAALWLSGTGIQY
jgi:transposase-like protein